MFRIYGRDVDLGPPFEEVGVPDGVGGDDDVAGLLEGVVKLGRDVECGQGDFLKTRAS